MHNPHTGLYVLWINYLPKALAPLFAYSETQYLVATSTDPQGPFDMTGPASLSQTAPGDADVFVDSNGTDAYIVYNGW